MKFDVVKLNVKQICAYKLNKGHSRPQESAYFKIEAYYRSLKQKTVPLQMFFSMYGKCTKPSSNEINAILRRKTKLFL